MHGNSFERKLSILKGNKQNLEIPVRNSWKGSYRESTPESLTSKSVNSNGRGSSSFSSSNFPGTNSNSANNPFSSPTPIVRKLFPGSPLQGTASNKGSSNLLGSTD
uniref:Uncharacterized protein n=1 Tax=Rhizophora mucronata TaxID=61149 RepID=A0A2P2K8J7_RHIMU